jgi:protein-tyrosine phosphatase
MICSAAICAEASGVDAQWPGAVSQMPNNYMIKKDNPSILFVCLGNICRSPLVEAVARRRCTQAGLQLTLGSCGTGNWHVGKGADPRMLRAAAEAGYDLASHRARQVRSDDFVAYDWVLAMDGDNLDTLRSLRRDRGSEPGLFLPWAGVPSPSEFPDPYFGDADGFRQSVALAERGVDGLIARLRAA